MTQIKNLIFDLGVVLVDLDRERCIQAFRELGITDVEKMISVAGHDGIFGQYELGAISTSEFYEYIRTLSGCKLTDEQIRSAWLSMLGKLPATKLKKLLELQNDYRVFLLSNTNELHWDWCADRLLRYEAFTADDLFEKQWLSYQIHLCKPDSSIFEYVLNDAELNPEETFFVDDAAANCITANKLGIRTYQPEPLEDWTPIIKERILSNII